MRPDTLTVSEAATYCGVDRRTMLRWLKRGLLRSLTTGGGRHRVIRSDLIRFMRARDYDVPAGLGGASMLIVDDDSPHNRALAQWFHHAFPGLPVHIAEDGFHGGLLVHKLRPQLLLLDLVMPGVDGFQVCEQIRSVPALEDTRIIGMSGAMTRRKERRLLDLGASACLAKPLDLATLERQIVSLLPEVARESA